MNGRIKRTRAPLIAGCVGLALFLNATAAGTPPVPDDKFLDRLYSDTYWEAYADFLPLFKKGQMVHFEKGTAPLPPWNTAGDIGAFYFCPGTKVASKKALLLEDAAAPPPAVPRTQTLPPDGTIPTAQSLGCEYDAQGNRAPTVPKAAAFCPDAHGHAHLVGIYVDPSTNDRRCVQVLLPQDNIITFRALEAATAPTRYANITGGPYPRSSVPPNIIVANQ